MSLIFGLLAATAWGIHDFCVRQVSRSIGVFASFVSVLFFGLIVAAPFSINLADADLPKGAVLTAMAAGVVFALAGIAMYKAFSLGPVRLVAPVIGAYPILSMGWASVTGASSSAAQWMAVFVVVLGVGYVAASEQTAQEGGSKKLTILWSIAASVGFALTFALGQAASSGGGELSLAGPTRLAALLTVLVIAFFLHEPIFPKRGQIWLLVAMGILDALALGLVNGAGSLDNPEFASVTASTFGVITIVLATALLREPMSITQWFAVSAVFVAIAFLGFVS